MIAVLITVSLNCIYELTGHDRQTDTQKDTVSISSWKRISQMSLMIDNCNSVSFCFFLIGDRSRGRMLVSQKRPIRLMTIYDTESAKPVLLLSAVYRYKPNLNIVHFIS